MSSGERVGGLEGLGWTWVCRPRRGVLTLFCVCVACDQTCVLRSPTSWVWGCSEVPQFCK